MHPSSSDGREIRTMVQVALQLVTKAIKYVGSQTKETLTPNFAGKVVKATIYKLFAKG